MEIGTEFSDQARYQARCQKPCLGRDGRRSRERFLVIFFTGSAYAIDQTMVMWVMTAMSNEPRLLVRYGGFFKGVLNAVLAITPDQEASGVSYL